ncbi:MAG TPA: N-acetylmuramoyl-L-alanine amidase [Edaphobacter sp.]|nr:N-acetylmuramoyl-L-alanine amidase [Edaphobacter sp.]
MVGSASAATRTVARRQAETTLWQRAVAGRETLEAIPDGSRTRADYTRAMDGFRAVYHTEPGDMHAPDSVNAVAELLAEQGRALHDVKSLENAVGQYEFLRTQYPGSSLRVAALLAEAQIYENDLHNKAAARAKYALFLKQYPRSEMAEEARAGLASLEGRDQKEAAIREPRTSGEAASASVASNGNAQASSFAPMPTTGAARRGLKVMPVGKPTSEDPDPSASSGQAMVHSASSSDVRQGTANPPEDVDEADDATPSAMMPMHVAKVSGRRGRPAMVTGIRHWSTPNYTRVAIDLGDDVTYEAARVPHPDRIYFDLHGTRLAQGLAGKSFTVTDDGFLKRIRAAQFSDDVTRVVLDVNGVSEYSAFLLPNPYRLIIDIHGGKGQGPGIRDQGPRTNVASAASSAVPNTVAEKTPNSMDVADLSVQPGRVEATTRPTSQPISAVVEGAGNKDRSAEDVAGVKTKAVRRGRHAQAEVAGVPARAAAPTADGETSMVRALGLKIGRIVIDAGHGGHDSGTLGVGGIEEKDVVLDVALRLGKLLHDRLGAEIIYTRSDDTFIPLETRTAIANKAQADLFISIHANSSPDESARGVEVYYLNFTTQPDALEVAARENAVSDQSIHQLSDLVKKITLKDKIDESREFAADVQQSLYDGLRKGNAGLKNRGVKKAPFVVLIGANMPSILAEISFVTNPKDAHELEEPAYRERVAESLYRGVAKYEAGLSSARSATPVERASAN